MFFLHSKAFKDIWGKGFTPGTFEVFNPEQLKDQTRIKGIPPVIVGLYLNSRKYFLGKLRSIEVETLMARWI
uniref:Uncharacterized protein n=1 Tax=Moorena producens (strain JHB) TaxID=1454205 RepID=A0A1D9G0G8_MOOP1